MSVADTSLSPEREAYIKQTANENATVPATFVSELLWEIERLRVNGGEKRRLLACGLCFEEHGEEVHPHPECGWGRYPEHDKLTLVKDKSQAVFDFLESVGEKGIALGRTVVTRVAVFEGTEECTAVEPVEERRLQELLAGHFGVDLARLDEEKQQMLDDLVAMNAPKGG
ncbi:hypothetical protein [Streptomyces sp. MH60]|uniref:hypothetical protein n=1 Tax=Streptomyces sp. MH60 TaxID=1940758 RepID=UPI000CEE97BA|nr:hypothetical protein [Streptomyces sp. MH60]PPS89421.1 hypothetical protein BZZ08_01567 [Streptomyces sp. MH60]